MAPKEKLPSIEDYPEKFRKSIVRLMSNENLDHLQVLDRAAALIDKNSGEFDEELQSRANSLYKSRHMVELNKARAGWKKKDDFEAKWKWTEGYEAAQKFVRENATVFRIPCSICGESVIVSSMDGVDLTAVNQVLLDAFRGWAHPSCASSSEE
jgi:hypothetical protein